ncbi:MAG: hypothetical protein IT471_10325 [Pseudomonadales bacterium]|nr:hypothetical protein [Pseudomonadales bacterium]MCC6530646.1 hypothetical protein [Pseudomonadales bacterium]MCP5332795.1 hypothetical protein [Pseudomonadales bacterium]HNL24638.1 hypothetical protein [Pseudomonadales bacterium]
MAATNFKTENNTFRKLIGNGLTYRIPRFQRDYSWDLITRLKEQPTREWYARATLQWCQHASAFTASVGGKPWKYLLVPHDEVNESRRLADYLHFEVKPHSCG